MHPLPLSAMPRPWHRAVRPRTSLAWSTYVSRLATKYFSRLVSPNHTHTRRCFATHIEHSKALPEFDGKKERVVILGSGWAGYTLSRRLSTKLYSPIIVSPRPYFVFTPLLTDAASGSLDFSNIVETVRDPRAKVDFIQAAARAVDLKKKTVLCEATVVKSDVTESPRIPVEERKRRRPEVYKQTARYIPSMGTRRDV